jgi:hypothetical protein
MSLMFVDFASPAALLLQYWPPRGVHPGVPGCTQRMAEAGRPVSLQQEQYSSKAAQQQPPQLQQEKQAAGSAARAAAAAPIDAQQHMAAGFLQLKQPLLLWNQHFPAGLLPASCSSVQDSLLSFPAEAEANKRIASHLGAVAAATGPNSLYMSGGWCVLA